MINHFRDCGSHAWKVSRISVLPIPSTLLWLAFLFSLRLLLWTHLALDDSSSSWMMMTTTTTSITPTMGRRGRRTTLLDRPEFSSRNLATEDGYSLDRPTGLHLAWIGDSVTRYQFLSLIHFLHTGRWVMDADFPNIVDISTFNNVWVDFFEYSSYILGQEQGQHQCDCYRASGGADGKHIFENRYYRDPARDNYLYFFTKMGSHPFHGRSSPREVSLWNTTSFNYTDEGEELWRYYSWGAMIRNVVAQMDPKPMYLIFNQGIWGDHDLNEETFDDIQTALRETGIRGLYKTTTRRSRENSTELAKHDVIGCYTIDLCMDVSWTASLSGPEHYFDAPGTHFVAHVNQRFNEQLLSILEED